MYVYFFNVYLVKVKTLLSFRFPSVRQPYTIRSAAMIPQFPGDSLCFQGGTTAPLLMTIANGRFRN